MNDDGHAPSRHRTADGEGAEELTFRVADLPAVRDHAAARARRRGMTEDCVGNVLLAVNEVATNAVTHGSGRARMRLWDHHESLVVEIHDTGHWVPRTTPGIVPPRVHATSGMGLWVSRMLSDDIRFDTGPRGTTVTMSFQV